MVKYPFLPQARRHVSETELDFETLVTWSEVRSRAKQRISASYSLVKRLTYDAGKDFEVEIASYPLAIMFVAAVEDRKLIERFALLEAQQINLFLKEEKRKEIILEIAKAFGWQVKSEHDKTQIHFAKFLENASRGRLVHDLKWKLSNRTLENGWVTVTPFELARLLQEEVKKRIEDSTKEKIRDLPEQILKDVEEIKADFLKMKPHLEEMDQVVKAQESEYPPCVTTLLKRAAEGKHLSHTERFTLVTYLLHQGVSVDSIVNLFSNVSDFKEAKTRYQVENLAGKTGGRTEAYVTYNCATLQTHGVCSGPKDPLCRTINNPLTYHLRKQKLNQRNN
jgi:DNA primase large subunit